MQSRKDPLFVFSLCFAASFSILLYVNATHGKFVYDDFKIIVENCFIKEWKYFPKIFTKDYFLISGEMSYRPLVTISYFIDYALWHSNPFGFHLTNIVLHTINTTLLFLLLNRIIQNKKIVFFSTLFFITHPVLIETVNAVGYREDLLSATFLLISLIYFIKSDILSSQQIHKKNYFIPFYAISLIAYFFALFSKEMAISMPILLPLLVLFSGEKIVPEILKRLKGIYIGYILLSLFYIIIRFVVLNNPSLKTAYQPGGFWVNILTMIKIMASYIALSFFPYNLNADYIVPLIKTPLEGSCILSILFAISTIVIFMLLSKSRNMLACWIGWFIIMLLPVMNIIPIGNIMAERYLYIPAMGFCVAKGTLIYRITDPTLSTHAMRLRKTVQLVLVLLTIGGYGFSIITKNGDWRDELTLWTKTIHRSPNSHRAHCNMGNVYMERGLIERAEAEYRTAAHLSPQNASVHSNLGTVYSKKKLFEMAIAEYNEAILLDSEYAQPHNNLGNIYYNRGEISKAKQEYEEALRIKPDYSHAHNGLGSVYDATGDLDKAMEEYKNSLYYDNNYIHARNNVGVNYAKRGKFSDAINEFQKAIEIAPDQPQGHYNLGLAFEKTGKQTDAIREYNTVLQIDPSNINTHYALGIIYEGLGLKDKAIERFQRVVILDSNNVNAYRHLVFLCSENKTTREMSRYYLKELLKIDPSLAQKEDIRQAIHRLRTTEK